MATTRLRWSDKLLPSIRAMERGDVLEVPFKYWTINYVKSAVSMTMAQLAHAGAPSRFRVNSTANPTATIVTRTS